MKTMKGAFSAIGKGLLILFSIPVLLCLVFFGITFFTNISKTKKEVESLKAIELYNPIKLEDGRTVNVSVHGNKESDIVFVPINDIGTADFNVFSKHMLSSMLDNVSLITVDRAGYGFSDDSQSPQTVEQIVEDYRSGLKAVDVKGKYVFLAHGFGGVYATYWANKYPDEVSGIIYLDGTPITDEYSVESYEVTNKDKIESLLFKFGFQRLFYSIDYSVTSESLYAKEVECAKALTYQKVKSQAQLSELSLMKQNFEEVKQMFSSTNAPKMYISSANSFRTKKEVADFFKYENAKNVAVGKAEIYDLHDENIEQIMVDFVGECFKKYENETVKFANAAGNCSVTRIPGSAKIYEQKTGHVTTALKDFVLYLNGHIPGIQESYQDSTMSQWEEYKNKD